jgi:hypothetical protein
LTIVNLCGDHLIRIKTLDDRIIESEYAGECARVNFKQVQVGTIDGVPIFKNMGGKVSGLPQPQDGTVYVVSRLLAEYVKRPDVCCPNSSPWHVVCRDGNGKPSMVDSLITYG